MCKSALQFYAILEQNKTRGLNFIKLICLRYWILKMSSFLLKNNDNSSKVIGQIGYFYALTKHHFTSQNYRGFEITVNIRECDLTNPDKIYQKNTKSSLFNIEPNLLFFNKNLRKQYRNIPIQKK